MVSIHSQLYRPILPTHFICSGISEAKLSVIMMITTEVKRLTLGYLFFGFCFHFTMTDDAPEFQYPCYVDVCTFPRQFCNSDKYERRCSPCSVSLCKEERIPLACKYQCNKLKKRK